MLKLPILLLFNFLYISLYFIIYICINCHINIINKNFLNLLLIFFSLIFYYIPIYFDFIYLINLIILCYLTLIFFFNFLTNYLLNQTYFLLIKNKFDLIIFYLGFNIIYTLLIIRCNNKYLFSLVKNYYYFFYYFISFIIIIFNIYLYKYILNIINFNLINRLKSKLLKIFNFLMKFFNNFTFLYYYFYYIYLIIYHIYKIKNIITIIFIFIYINYLEFIPSFYNMKYKINKKKIIIFNIEKLISNIFLYHVKKTNPIQYNSLKNCILLNKTSNIFFNIININNKSKLLFTYPFSLYSFEFFYKYLSIKYKKILFQFKLKNKQNIYLYNLNKCYNYKIDQKNSVNKNVQNNFENFYEINYYINYINIFNLINYKLKKLYKKKYKYIYNILAKEKKINIDNFKNNEIKSRRVKQIHIISFSDVYKQDYFQKLNNNEIYLMKYYNHIDFLRDFIKGMSNTKAKKIKVLHFLEKNVSSILINLNKYKYKKTISKKKNYIFDDIEDFFSDFIPFIQIIKSLLLLIQLYFRKYIKLPIFIILNNFFKYIFLKNKTLKKNIETDFQKLKNEIYIYCNYDNIELSENKISKNLLLEGLKIKILFCFNNLDKEYLFLTLWGNLTSKINLSKKKNKKQFFKSYINIYIYISFKKIIKIIYNIKYILIWKKKKIKKYSQQNFKHISQYFILNNLFKNFYKFKFFLNKYFEYNKFNYNKIIFYLNYNKINYNKYIYILNKFFVKNINNKKNIVLYLIQLNYLQNLLIINNLKIYCFYIKKNINKKILSLSINRNEIYIDILINFDNFYNLYKENFYIQTAFFSNFYFKKAILIKFQFIFNYLINNKKKELKKKNLFYFFYEFIYINKNNFYINIK